MVTICFYIFSYCNNLLIITHCCSNESISNIDTITLIKTLDLVHCAARKVLPSVWKHSQSFTGGVSVDEYGVVIVVIVSPKQKELQLFFLGISNDCESSLSLPLVLPWWLVLWYNPEYSKSCSPTEASEALVRWFCIELSERCGMT